MQKLFLLFAAVIVIALPAVASADTITFQAPATAPNVGSGGSRQFDLDHHSAYTWKIGGVNLQELRIDYLGMNALHGEASLPPKEPPYEASVPA